jgi:hypothetical protein
VPSQGQRDKMLDYKTSKPTTFRRHDIQYDDIEQNDTLLIKVPWFIVCVVTVLFCCECHYAEQHSAKCHSAERRSAECHSAERCSVKCHSDIDLLSVILPSVILL